MDLSWLFKKVTVEQVETDFLEKDDRISPEPVPFGYYFHQWCDLKKELQDGDELWLFSSPKETWLNMCGRAGICIVRSGNIVYSLTTTLN